MSRETVEFTSELGVSVKVVQTLEGNNGVHLVLSDNWGDNGVRRYSVYLNDEDIATLRWALIEVSTRV